MTYPSSPSACEARFTMLPRMQEREIDQSVSASSIHWNEGEPELA